MVTARAVAFDGSKHITLPYIERLDVFSTESQHDYAKLSLVGGGPTLLGLQSAPVHLDVTANGVRFMFHGYLDVSNPARSKGMTGSSADLLGITSVMRNHTARAWSNTLPRRIISEIISPYRLGLEMDDVSTTTTFLSQNENESDWQLLVRYAGMLGLAVVTEGIIVKLIEVAKEMRRAIGSGYRTFTIPSSKGGGADVEAFSVKATSSPLGVDYRDVTIRGTDALGQPFVYRRQYDSADPFVKPSFSSEFSGTVTSLDAAMTVASKINSQARWTHIATATCNGYRSVSAGDVVLVRDEDGTFAGLWYVTDVHHVISKEHTASEITMCRDTGLKLSTAIPPTALNLPLPRLVNSQWQSDRQWEKII